MKKICAICNKKFESRKNNKIKSYVCSYKCDNEFDKWNKIPNVKCCICNKDFYVKESRIKRLKNSGITCSKECGYKYKSLYSSKINNHQYALKGALNVSWKGEKIIHHGYIYVKAPEDHPFKDKHGRIREHRLIAERYWLTLENSININNKYYLKPEYVVHHINFNKKDNRPTNLRVLTKKEHTELHNRMDKLVSLNRVN